MVNLLESSIESEMSEILPENLRNLIRETEEIRIKKFDSVKKLFRKNSDLVVNELAEVLLQSKENQNCLGLTLSRCILVFR